MKYPYWLAEIWMRVQFPPPRLKALVTYRKRLYLLNLRHFIHAQGCGDVTRRLLVRQIVYIHRDHFANTNLSCCARNSSESRYVVIHRRCRRNPAQYQSRCRTLMRMGSRSAQLRLSSRISGYFVSSGRRSAVQPCVPRRACGGSRTIAWTWSVTSWVQSPPPQHLKGRRHRSCGGP
jgi:hypothetical protein